MCIRDSRVLAQITAIGSLPGPRAVYRGGDEFLVPLDNEPVAACARFGFHGGALADGNELRGGTRRNITRQRQTIR